MRKQKTVAARIDDDLHRQFSLAAKQSRESESAFIRAAIREKLAREKGGRK